MRLLEGWWTWGVGGMRGRLACVAVEEDGKGKKIEGIRLEGDTSKGGGGGEKGKVRGGLGGGKSTSVTASV